MGNQHGRERRDHGRKIDWKNAERPSPPGKPYLVPEEGDRRSDVITIRWSPPVSDGGAPVVGYLVEHRRTGSPHWLRATPDPVLGAELLLTGLEPGWRYQFRVSAANDVGWSEPGELSEPLTVTRQKWAASAPFFNLELADTVGLENEKVEFKVQVIGIPPPTIAWYKDGFEVFSSRRTKITTENDQSAFVIHQAALEDEGEIKCTATNRAGYAVTKAVLRLEAPPRIRLPRQYEEGLIFEKGELIRLKVTTAGRPGPQVSWYHNGELLQRGERVEVVTSETGSTVRISDACREDRGEYLIKGVNKIGEDVASVLVTVTDRPSPPGKVRLGVAGRRVTLSWSSPEDDGGCKIGTYIVEYFRMGWDMWLKAKNSRQLSTALDDLIEGSEYKFRVRAENPYGISEPSEESDVVFLPDPKRGVLTPPPRTDTLELLKEADERDRGREEEEPEEVKRRRLLEDKARKLLDTPLSVLLPQDENKPPPVPKRRNKGKGRLTPSPVEPPDLVNGSLQKPDWSPDEPKYSFDAQSPMYPRENDDSILHGSSELMLVIYPRDRSKSVELSAQQRSEIETSLAGEGVAPPMSLSAPELGCSELFQQPLTRDAVSSSELLYERTMARLYQDSIDEEAQRTVRRRYSVERRASLKEPLERRLSFKEEPPKPPFERLNSVERERLEFAIVRERLKRKEEQKPRRAVPPATNECETSTTTATSSSFETEDLEEDYEDDEYMEEEEDYLEAAKPKRPESLPARIAPHARPEDDTYHPRSMIPTRSVVSRVEKPLPDPAPAAPATPEPKKEEKPSRIPVPHQGKPKKASKLLKKFGLKKDKKVPEVTLTPADSNMPKPILKNKTARRKDSPKSLLRFGLSRPSDRSVSEEESENEGGRKKKQVRISEPNEEPPRTPEKPVDRNARENQVLIFHYSDIVREFGGHKRPPARLYLNYEELKAHAKPEDAEKPNPPPVDPPEPPPAEPETRAPTPEPETRIRSSLEYVTDVLMFLVACWLYLFKNELYAIPVLCLMAYRQLKALALDRYRRLRELNAKPNPGELRSEALGAGDK